ncbi:hypothetical protein LUX01_04535 [Streptomyces sudanensis]|uniref:hypothetical protein n=1 Tax=Streptomyces sudanensis TaxID=436397 RepID=UPI0020CC0CF2|nr:hypothetical protein [Streptomyces sudanensis]MCP9986094.1 hypothetical protein [Streptomyces sudanensis]
MKILLWILLVAGIATNAYSTIALQGGKQNPRRRRRRHGRGGLGHRPLPDPQEALSRPGPAPATGPRWSPRHRSPGSGLTA